MGKVTLLRTPFCEFRFSSKNIPNFCLKTEPESVGADAMGYVWFLCYSEKPDICRCIHSSHNRLGFLPRFTFFFMNEGIRIRRAKCFLCTYLISGFGTMFEQCNTWSKCSSIIHTVSGTKFFLSIQFVRIYSKNILLGSGYRGVGPTWPQLLPGDL